MRLISWNVNGIRAAIKKEFANSLEEMKTDIICLQETKAQDDQVIEALKIIDGYYLYSNSAVKKGYSGTAILTKEKPISVAYDIGIEEHDTEGRVLTLEYKDFYLVNVYTPNSGSELKRLDYRSNWDKEFLKHLKKLEKSKPVIMCGDLNVCHKPIDLARPKPNYNKSAGYTQREIDGMDNINSAGFIDSFRFKNPDTVKYSWWSYRAGARANNVGWRLDYFYVSPELKTEIKDADILVDIMGSDHCPIVLDLKK